MIFLSPVDAFLGWYLSFGIAISSVSLLRVGWRGGFSSHKVSWCVQISWNMPICGFFNNMCCPTPWHFGEIYRDPLHYLGFPFDCLCPTFLGRGSEVVGKFDLNFRCSPILFPGCWGIPIARPETFLQVSRPLVPCAIGAPKFFGGLLRYFEQCPGKPSPCALFLAFCDGGGIDGISSILFDRIYYVAVFTLIL